MKFPALIKKNVKNLFRNWTSIFILIIGPLMLMGVLILAFSNMGFYNINIGYVGEETVIEPVREQISYIGNFVKYPSITSCKNNLKKQEVHLCLDLKSGEITNVDIHYDSTREVISLILITQIRRGVTRQKDELLKDKATDLVAQLSEINYYINSKQQTIGDVIIEMEGYRREIVDMRTEIWQTKNEIEGHIERLENIREDVRDVQRTTTGEYSRTSTDTRREIDDALNSLSNARSALILTGQSTTDVDTAIYSLNQLKNSMNEMDNVANEINKETNNIIGEIDSTLTSLRNARQSLIEAHTRLGQIHAQLGEREEELRRLDAELGEKREGLAEVQNINIEHLINPFAMNFKPLFTGSERIKKLAETNVDLTKEQAMRLANVGSVQTLIPLVISLMICFISVIISNIIIIDEKNSPAYLRDKVLPVPWIEKTTAVLITILSVVMLQVGTILFIGYSLFFLDIMGSLGTIILASTLLILIYAMLGLALGYIINSATTSLLVASFFLIINIFLSGMVFPVERMSPIMVKMSSIIPFRDGVSILQQTIFYQVQFSSMTTQFVKLTGILLMSMAVLYFSYRIGLTKFQKGK